MRRLNSLPVIVIILGVLIGNIYVYSAQASVEITGIINSDTTWTKANSPYTFTGNILVSKGVILTIEPGVTVNFNGYYIRVNGTMSAIGNSAEKIYFSNGQIDFTSASNSWNEQTGSGSIIENAILNNSISISNASPKLSKNSISYAINIEHGSPIISDNNINGTITALGGTAIISNNIITGKISLPAEGSPEISNNTITGGISTLYGSPVIFNNIIIGTGRAAIFVGGGNPVISKNTIKNGNYGIELSAGLERFIMAVISDNTISECTTAGIYAEDFLKPTWGTCTATIERNLINNVGKGITVGSSKNIVIRSNTIANNSVGINNPSSSTLIINNNIQNNIQNSIYMYDSTDVNATYNWWGTTDTQTINQTIFDFKNDFNLGTINFVPFLTEPNPQAVPDPNAPIPTPAPSLSSSPSPSTSPSPSPTPSTSPSPSQSPTVSPGQSGTQIPIELSLEKIVILLLSVIVVLLIVVIALTRKRNRK